MQPFDSCWQWDHETHFMITHTESIFVKSLRDDNLQSVNTESKSDGLFQPEYVNDWFVCKFKLRRITREQECSKQHKDLWTLIHYLRATTKPDWWVTQVFWAWSQGHKSGPDRYDISTCTLELVQRRRCCLCKQCWTFNIIHILYVI